MNCEVGNLEAQMQMDVAFLLWSLFSKSPLQKRNQMFMLWRFHWYSCYQSLNSMQDLKPNFRSGCLLLFLCFWERESSVRKRGEKKFRFRIDKSRRETEFKRKRNWEIFFRWESLTETAPVSNMAELDLRWNWCVILIDVVIFNWAK